MKLLFPLQLIHSQIIIIMIQFEQEEPKEPQTQQYQSLSHRSYLRDLPNFKYPQKIDTISYPKNMISKIRSSICKAVNATQINLCHNKITSIQPLFLLTNLRLINVSYNMITNIGLGLGKLQKLETVDVGYNLLGTMGSIKGLVKLWEVRKGNVGIILQGNDVIKKEKDKISNIFTMKSLSDEKKIQQGKLNAHSLNRSSSLQKTMNRGCKKGIISERQTERNKKGGMKKQNNESKNLDISMILPAFPSSELSVSSANIVKEGNKNKSTSLLLDASSILPSQPSQEIKKLHNNSYNYLQILKEMRSKNNVKLAKNQSSQIVNPHQRSFYVFETKKLQQIKQKLQILLNTCCNKWSNNLYDLLKQQYEAINVYIDIHFVIITLPLGGNKDSLEQHVGQAEQIRQMIKTSHNQLLNILREEKQTPVKVYRIWVNLVRDLYNICSSIVKDAWQTLADVRRKKQLQQLQKLSPDKNMSNIGNSKMLKKEDKIKIISNIANSPQQIIDGSNQKRNPDLQKLLFSNKKKQSHENMNTVQKNKSNKSVEDCCDQCFLKEEQIKYLRTQNAKELQKNRINKQEIHKLKMLIQSMKTNMKDLQQRNKELQERTMEKQKNIINKLDQKITAGVYQEVLLSQAHGIQALLKSTKHSHFTHFNSFAQESNNNTTMLNSNPNQWGYQTQRNIKNTTTNKNNKISYFSHQTSQQNVQPNVLSNNEENMSSQNGYRVKTFESNEDGSSKTKNKLYGNTQRDKESLKQIDDNGKRKTQLTVKSKQNIGETLKMSSISQERSKGNGVTTTGSGKTNTTSPGFHDIKKNKQNKNVSNRTGCVTVAGKTGCVIIAEEDDDKDMIVVSDFAVLTQNNNNKKDETDNKQKQKKKEQLSQRYQYSSSFGNSMIGYKPLDKLHDKQPYAQYISHHLRNQIMNTLLSKKVSVNHHNTHYNTQSHPMIRNNRSFVSAPKNGLITASNRHISLSLDSKGKGQKPRYIKA